MKTIHVTVRLKERNEIVAERDFTPEYDTPSEIQWFTQSVIRPWVKSIQFTHKLSDDDVSVDFNQK